MQPEKKKNKSALASPPSALIHICIYISHKILISRTRLLRILRKRLLPIRIILDDQGTRRVGAQPLASLHGQLGRELEPAGPLDGLDGDLEIGQRLLVRDRGVGQHEGADGDGARDGAVLGEDDLVEMGRHGDVGRVANHLVGDAPFPIGGVAFREVERPRHDAHAGVAGREAVAEIFKVRPVVAVEALADLRAHVGEVEGIVHGLLAPFRVGGGYLVASVVAGSEIVFELAAELFRDCRVLEEDGVFAVAVRFC